MHPLIATAAGRHGIPRGAVVRKFKVTYVDGSWEVIEAATYGDVQEGRWIEFMDGSGPLLRVRAETVMRVEQSRE